MAEDIIYTPPAYATLHRIYTMLEDVPDEAQQDADVVRRHLAVRLQLAPVPDPGDLERLHTKTVLALRRIGGLLPQGDADGLRDLVSIDPRCTHRPLKEARKLELVFPDEVFFAHVVPHLGPSDVIQLENTCKDFGHTPFMHTTWVELGRARFRDARTGQVLSGFSNFLALLKTNPEIPPKHLVLWFNVMLQYLACTFIPGFCTQHGGIQTDVPEHGALEAADNDRTFRLFASSAYTFEREGTSIPTLPIQIGLSGAGRLFVSDIHYRVVAERITPFSLLTGPSRSTRMAILETGRALPNPIPMWFSLYWDSAAKRFWTDTSDYIVLEPVPETPVPENWQTHGTAAVFEVAYRAVADLGDSEPLYTLRIGVDEADVSSVALTNVDWMAVARLYLARGVHLIPGKHVAEKGLGGLANGAFFGGPGEFATLPSRFLTVTHPRAPWLRQLILSNHWTPAHRRPSKATIYAKVQSCVKRALHPLLRLMCGTCSFDVNGDADADDANMLQTMKTSHPYEHVLDVLDDRWKKVYSYKGANAVLFS